MKNESPQISVIIVNYNVRDFLEQCLLSIKRALKDIPSEIIVVDNASVDGSVQMLKERFPEVYLIESKTNLGFSAGNNLALKRAKGSFIVLINPDTVVQENTFQQLLDFFQTHPDASAATCKILNPDGTFSVDCRHSVPTPATAFWKLLGLNRLFPKSRIFGRYNLTYLDENEINQVEAISGSFMMIRREVVEKVGPLDETFFMYCEDIDYCHRINQAGGKIYYVPDSQIIHYKGESTKKNNLDYVITFNRSLYKFYRKHYQKKYIYPFKWLILLGTIIRGILIFFRNNIQVYYPVLLDLFLLNLVMFFSFYARYELRLGFRLEDFFNQYIVINLMTSVVFFIAALFFDIIVRDKYSISKIIKTNLVTFTFISALTFFFKMFAFSRLVVVVSALFATLLMVLWRFLLRTYRKRPGGVLSRDYFYKRTLIVGFDSDTKRLLDKLNSLVTTGLEFIGLVSEKEDDIGKKLSHLHVVTSLQRLPEYIRMQKIDLVIFTTHQIPYQSILATMMRVQNPQIDFKMVPDHMEFMIGKSTIERLDTIPLVDIEYAYGKLFNRFTKRIVDLMGAITLLVLLGLPALLLYPFYRRTIRRRPIYLANKVIDTIRWCKNNTWLRFYLHLIDIVEGRLSFVGAPLAFTEDDCSVVEYKPGLTGLIQLNRSRITNQQVRENYELHYLKNQNLFLDLEILLRTFIKK